VKCDACVCLLLCEQKCHVTEQEVHNALLSGDQQDQLVIAYHLVLDNNRIADEADKLQIHDFFVASSPPVESFMLVSSHTANCCVDVICCVCTDVILVMMDERAYVDRPGYEFIIESVPTLLHDKRH